MAGVQVVQSDHTTKSSINVVRLSFRSMRLQISSLVLCVAAMTLPAAAFGQSRETLGEGDSVRITVFQNPDLTTETRISERGTITFPLVGEIVLAGLTPAGAEARIAKQLKDTVLPRK